MKQTYKIEIVGTIDSNIELNNAFEFEWLDKAGILDRIASCAADGKTMTLVDIHGNVLSLNFGRIKVLSIKVIEVIN